MYNGITARGFFDTLKIECDLLRIKTLGEYLNHKNNEEWKAEDTTLEAEMEN